MRSDILTEFTIVIFSSTITFLGGLMIYRRSRLNWKYKKFVNRINFSINSFTIASIDTKQGITPVENYNNSNKNLINKNLCQKYDKNSKSTL